MDPEQTFLRVHARLSGMLLRVLTPKIRTGLEYLHFAVAVALFCSLVVMHTNFVQQPGCSAEISKVKIGEPDLVHIKISSAGLWSHAKSGSRLIETLEKKSTFADSATILNDDGDGLPLLSVKYWFNWAISGLRKTKPSRWKIEKEFLEPYSEMEVSTDFEMTNVERRISTREWFRALIYRFYVKCQKIFALSWGMKQKHAGSDISPELSKWPLLFQLYNLRSVMVEWLEMRGRSFESTYMYTTEKGYFWLSEEAKLLHNIQTVNVTIPAQHSCFGNRWQQHLINIFIGYDTILVNSFLSLPGQDNFCNTSENTAAKYASSGAAVEMRLRRG